MNKAVKYGLSPTHETWHIVPQIRERRIATPTQKNHSRNAEPHEFVVSLLF